MEYGPFEDVFPIGHVDFPASYVSLPGGNDSVWAGPINYTIRNQQAQPTNKKSPCTNHWFLKRTKKIHIP